MVGNSTEFLNNSRILKSNQSLYIICVSVLTLQHLERRVLDLELYFSYRFKDLENAD